MLLFILFFAVYIALQIYLGGAVILVGIAGLGIWCISSPRDVRRFKVFLCSLAMPVMMVTLSAVLNLVSRSCPFRYDLFLHAIDHTLGICPPQLLARTIHTNILYPVVAEAYLLMPTMMLVGYGWAVYGGSAPNRLLLSYLLTSTSALLYLIVPASGPVFILGKTLLTAHPSSEIALIHLDAIANCIPSVHLSTALLIWSYNRNNGAYGKLALAFVFVTAFATLALGEHYLIDLVLSFPYTLFLVALPMRFYRRAAISLLVVIAWLVAIKIATPHLIAYPVLLWSAAAITVVCSYLYLPSPAAAVSQASPAPSADSLTAAVH